MSGRMQFDQLIVDATIIQWRRHLNASVCVRGVHFEHNFWQFWNELLYELKFW